LRATKQSGEHGHRPSPCGRNAKNVVDAP
jgi:hypothetical protein